MGNYDTLACSQLVMFQIVTTSNWQVLVSTVIEQKNSQWTALFFISWLVVGLTCDTDSHSISYIITVFVILSLTIGVFIDAFFKASQLNAKTAQAEQVC